MERRVSYRAPALVLKIFKRGKRGGGRMASRRSLRSLCKILVCDVHGGRLVHDFGARYEEYEPESWRARVGKGDYICAGHCLEQRAR